MENQLAVPKVAPTPGGLPVGMALFLADFNGAYDEEIHEAITSKTDGVWILHEHGILMTEFVEKLCTDRVMRWHIVLSLSVHGEVLAMECEQWRDDNAKALDSWLDGHEVRVLER